MSFKNNEYPRITFFSVIVFFIGLPSIKTINFQGELYLTELLLPFAAAIILFKGGWLIFRLRIFWVYFILGNLILLGYVLSDVIAGTDQTKYLRAWGRVILLLVDLVSLAIIALYDRKLFWWFLLGNAVGAIGILFLSGVPIHEWKLGYGKHVILLTILVGTYINIRFAMFALLTYGTLSIFLDNRSLGSVCLILAGVLYLRIKYPIKLNIKTSSFFRVLVSLASLIIIVVTLINITNDDFSNRREASSVGRFTGLKVGLIAIMDSPVIGHGSWGEGTEKYANMLYKDLLHTMIELDRARTWSSGEIFRPHSQILQVWVEGGILSAMFFIFFAYKLIASIQFLIVKRRLDATLPIYMFLLINSLWHVLMSPFGGAHRLQIAVSIVVTIILSVEVRKMKFQRAKKIK